MAGGGTRFDDDVGSCLSNGQEPLISDDLTDLLFLHLEKWFFVSLRVPNSAFSSQNLGSFGAFL